ncbi:MAG: RDD family protein [Pyrinomonadaceae bacterium]
MQERRAREAAQEANAAGADLIVESSKGPLLELIPPADLPPLNPLVEAALRRIERAHATSHFGSNALAIAVDCEEQPEYGEDMSLMTNEADANAIAYRDNMSNSLPEERVHNLAVVPTSPAVVPKEAERITKPRRLITGDLNDPALNYLESIPTALDLDRRDPHVASLFSRAVSAIVDLIVVSGISAGIVTLALLPDLRWQEPRVIMYAVVTGLVVAFFYLTISTAMTGRTLGMRLLSLRVIDARTGFVPTGRQAAGGATIYILSLVFAGIPLLYTFFDAERNTFHDRFTQTAVIRA